MQVQDVELIYRCFPRDHPGEVLLQAIEICMEKMNTSDKNIHKVLAFWNM